MNIKINRPTDHYSPLWAKYWEQNPLLRKGVGADGVDDKAPEELAAEALAATNADWQSKIDVLTAENERWIAKHGEAEKHKKAAETKKDSAERERLLSEKNFEQLYESSQASNEKLTNDIAQMGLKAIAGQEKSTQDKFGERLTDHASSVRFLSRGASDRIKIIDGVVRVLDVNGNLSVATLDDLEIEYRKNSDYDRLIDGVDSSGGSASGSSSNGGAAKIYTRADFAALNPAQKMQVSKDVRTGKAEIID